MKTIKPDELNYCPKSISFVEGFFGPRGNVGYQMEVDTRKAKAIVQSLLKSGRNIERAELGLDGDFEINNTTIYDGKFHRYEAFSESCWAEPTLIVYFEDRPSEMYRCWKKKVST